MGRQYRPDGAVCPGPCAALARPLAMLLGALHGGELLERSRSVAHEIGMRMVLILGTRSRHRVERLRATDLVHVQAVDASAVQAEDLALDLVGERWIAEALLKFLRDLEGAKGLDLILR